MNMIVVAAHPGWKVAYVGEKSKQDDEPIIAWLIRIDENAGAIVVKPLTPWGEPPDNDPTWGIKDASKEEN